MAVAQTDLGMGTTVEPVKDTVVTTPVVSLHAGRLSRFLDKGIGVGLVFTVVFTALAHGAVEAWAAALFGLIVISLVAAWGIKVIIDGRVSLKIPAVIFPLAGLAVIGAVQGIAFTAADGHIRSFSMNVEATRASIIAIVILAASCLLAANFWSTHKRLRHLCHFLVVFGFAMALFALIQSMSWNGKFFWLRSNSVGLSPFGPFVNHNNFAGYMELLVPIPIGLMITRAFRAEVRLFYGFAALVMAVAVVASLSRGGIISLIAGLIFLALMGPVTRPEHASTHGKKHSRLSLHGLNINGRHFSLLKAGFTAICLAAAIAGGVIFMSSDKVGGGHGDQSQAGGAQSGPETFFTSRGWIWRDTMSMIKAKPFTGVGLGAFETAYPIYSGSDGTVGVDRAHNDYFQIVAECGVLAGVLVLWFIWSTGKGVMHGIASRDRLLAGLALGGGAGIFSLLVHSIFDFNLQLPSNALLFLLISTLISLIGADLVSVERKRVSHLHSSTGSHTESAILQESTS